MSGDCEARHASGPWRGVDLSSGAVLPTLWGQAAVCVGAGYGAHGSCASTTGGHPGAVLLLASFYIYIYMLLASFYTRRMAGS